MRGGFVPWFQRVERGLGCAGTVMMFSPVGLHEDAIDVLECDGPALLADGLDEGAEAEVASASDEAIARSDDECQGLIGEGVVCQSNAIELIKDEDLNDLGREGLKGD